MAVLESSKVPGLDVPVMFLQKIWAVLGGDFSMMSCIGDKASSIDGFSMPFLRENWKLIRMILW